MDVTSQKKLLSVFTPVFNEEENVRRCYEEVRRVCLSLGEKYDYEHVFADNCSEDRTLAILREIAAGDPRVKVIAYSRNFGAEKSGFMGMRHVSGDVVTGIPADLQEPPSAIPLFLKKWEEGHEVVLGIYRNPYESVLRRSIRALYYRLIDWLSPEPLPRDHSGFGLTDRVVIDEIIKVDDFNPYIRGLIATIGFRQAKVPYERGTRMAGKSKHGLMFLLGFGMNGMIVHSLMPIRLATISGVALAFLAIALSIIYTFMKLFNWNIQARGATTTIVLTLFFSGVQLMFLGLLGEYIGAIHSQVRRKPFVVVRERINVGTPKRVAREVATRRGSDSDDHEHRA